MLQLRPRPTTQRNTTAKQTIIKANIKVVVRRSSRARRDSLFAVSGPNLHRHPDARRVFASAERTIQTLFDHHGTGAQPHVVFVRKCASSVRILAGLATLRLRGDLGRPHRGL